MSEVGGEARGRRPSCWRAPCCRSRRTRDTEPRVLAGSALSWCGPYGATSAFTPRTGRPRLTPVALLANYAAGVAIAPSRQKRAARHRASGLITSRPRLLW